MRRSDTSALRHLANLDRTVSEATSASLWAFATSDNLARYSLPAFFKVYRCVCCFMQSQSWLTTSQLTMGACPSADATVKPFATRPVLLSYTNAAPTVIKAPRIIPNKIRMVGAESYDEQRWKGFNLVYCPAKSLQARGVGPVRILEDHQHWVRA